MRALSLVLGLVLAAPSVRAQPVTSPEDLPQLAKIRDDKQLAEALSEIAQDPAIRVEDPKARPLAQALMSEGVRELQVQAYDQALANFLEAYNKLPSPKILLNIASTLRDMGRLADAANTYQRYLADPTTGPERVAEVKDVLGQLDQQLTILTIRVFPRGSEVSIDGGPFVAVGSSLLTRVRPGLHLVRVKKGEATTEITVNGFEGESKDVAAAVKEEVPVETAAGTGTGTVAAAGTATAAGTGTGTGSGSGSGSGKGSGKTVEGLPIETTIPDHVDGWLITGTQYGSGGGRERRVRTGYAGPELAAIVPQYETTDGGQVIVHYPGEHISSGVVGVMRVDGKGRGVAGGLGIAYTPEDHVELELAGLRSDFWGAYLGVRYRFLTGPLRPYAAAGMPLFFFDDDKQESKVAIGVRGAGGVELVINGHFSVEGDLGIEYFFNVSGVTYMQHTLDDLVFVPTLGVIGRM